MIAHKHPAGPYQVIGSTVYALEVFGFQRGVERKRNRFSANVQSPHTSQEELEAIATLFHAAPDLLAAAECADALDMPGEAGWPILERHGWDRAKRFDLTATEFVARLRRAAIAKATTQNKEDTP